MKFFIKIYVGNILTSSIVNKIYNFIFQIVHKHTLIPSSSSLCKRKDAVGGLVFKEIIFVKMSLMIGPGLPWSFTAAGGQCVFAYNLENEIVDFIYNVRRLIYYLF